MSEELYFDVELRNCLDAAGFSDCGESDQWNWWYQRLHQAHDVSVDRVTDAQRIENAKLRGDVERMFNANVKKNGEIARLLDENDKLREYLTMACRVIDAAVARGYNAADSSIKEMHATLKDLGMEVDE